jgi:hypothetical protein
MVMSRGMRMLRCNTRWCVLGMWLSSSAIAETELAGHLGVSWGGSEYHEREDGYTISAGGILYGGLGFAYAFDRAPLQFQGTVGYKVDGTRGTNGDGEFHRPTAEALAFYQINRHHRIGAGMSVHYEPEYEWVIWDPDNTSDRHEGHIFFDSAQGYIVQYDYLLDNVSFGVRYEWIEYEGSKLCLDDECSVDEELNIGIVGDVYNPDASSVGIHIAFRFGADDFSAASDWRDW